LQDFFNCFHGDLKLENILINENFDIEMIDFGSSGFIPNLNDVDYYYRVFRGTPIYAPPEIIGKNVNDPKKWLPYRGPEADVWALGIIMYTLVFRQFPFITTKDIVENRIAGIDFCDKNSRLTELILRILDTNIETRPTIRQIKDEIVEMINTL
jgi:serine/threonine protein kinase